MTTEDTTYNGWTNYETWVTNMWLTAEPETSRALDAIVQASGAGRGVRAEEVKELVMTVYDFPTTGLVADLLTATLDRVDWGAIVAAHQEE